MKIGPGKRVRLRVKLEVVGGKVLEESVVDYVHGDGRMLPGLEQVLEDLEAGSVKKGVLEAAHAFGDERRLPVKKLPRREFPAAAQLEVGGLFTAHGPNGEEVVLRVMALEEDHVVAKFLHPLWDKDIGYELHVLLVVNRVPPPLPAEAVATEDTEGEGEAG